MGDLKSLRTAAIWWTALVVCLNIGAVLAAWKDQSYGAIGIALIFGPILNGFLVLISPLWRRREYQSDLAPSLAAVAALSPIPIALIDLLLILMMPLHGS